MADPLSTATRTTKRNLLVVSILAISATAFNVKVDKIPIGGLSITFDDHLFAFLLLVSLLYFFCTFVLYYFVDIKNIEVTGHQEHSESRYSQSESLFRSRFHDRAMEDVGKIVGKEYFVTLKNGIRHDWLPDEVTSPSGIYTIRKRETQGRNMVLVDVDVASELYANVDARLDYWIKRFKRDRRWLRLKERFLISSVRLTYLLRNYVVDGALPVLLGIIAILATFGVVRLNWLQNLFPIVGSPAL